jgi:hypothetical protein
MHRNRLSRYNIKKRKRRRRNKISRIKMKSKKHFIHGS